MLLSMIKQDNISYWVSQGYELAWRDFFSSNDKFSPEIQKTMVDAANQVSIVRNIECSEAFLQTWKDTSKKIAVDTLKILALGPVVADVLISDFPKIKQEEIFLRTRCCVKAIENLYLSNDIAKGWKERILQKIDVSGLNFGGMSTEKALIIAEFASFHLVKHQFESLRGKSLRDFVCWNVNDEKFANTIQSALQLKMQELPPSCFTENPFNLFHVISGGLRAASQKQEESDQYFALMQKYLTQLPPVLAEDPVDLISYKELFEFILQHVHDEAMKKIALKGLRSSRPVAYALEIKKLDLQSRCLKTLPESIALLQNLIYLDLCNNRLETVPECVKKLSQLKVLVLKGNKLTELPPFLAKMDLLNKLVILQNPIREVSPSLKEKIRDLPYSARWSKD